MQRFFSILSKAATFSAYSFVSLTKEYVGFGAKPHRNLLKLIRKQFKLMPKSQIANLKPQI
jgi:hypothetical protein